MDITAFSLDLIKYVLAGCIVVGLANWMFWTKYNSYTFKLKMLEKKHAVNKDLLPLRLQAYERLILFAERINPANLLIRLHEQGLSAEDFEQHLVNEIRAEYQHNVTQQLYVSNAAWSVTKQIKDNTVALIRNARTGLQAGASAKELSNVILGHVAALDENPYELALKTIKNELMS
ncbi:hypothetical protein GCM10011386_25720 [Parapedobacter defluvii]|uniref:Uncharacterized protein n=1 Tax=Parapedobacter defluvii TaxID=2045106 RepID=A0ABQ1M053_9SPHI|nr:hypothetical protein [Parapedobacter defluvii]GGC32418.1 hypothetical protein GCM10011386_25720 [Parapedobacter defluvii]